MREEESALLEVRNVSRTYRSRKRQPVYALREVGFSLEEGRCLGVVGESGCGKSTLCRVIAGIEKPDTGEILYRGKLADYRKIRSGLQMVFQNSMDTVNIHLKVGKILAEPLENFTSLNRSQREREVERLLELVGLSPEDKTKYPRQFSGGQLQRICIARALAADPKLLLLDEPLSSLDVSVQAQLLNLLADLKTEFHLTCILVSHDLEAVYYLADSLLVMYGGAAVEEIGDIRDFHALRHPYTRRLLDAGELGTGVLEAGELAAGAWENGELETGASETGLPEEGSLAKGEKKGGSADSREGCVYAGHCPRAERRCFLERPGLVEREPGHRIACHFVHVR